VWNMAGRRWYCDNRFSTHRWTAGAAVHGGPPHGGGLRPAAHTEGKSTPMPLAKPPTPLNSGSAPTARNPVSMRNDADATGIAEMAFGAAKARAGVVGMLTFEAGGGRVLSQQRAGGASRPRRSLTHRAPALDPAPPLLA
jgi:hypothetical protein